MEVDFPKVTLSRGPDTKSVRTLIIMKFGYYTVVFDGNHDADVITEYKNENSTIRWNFNSETHFI